MVQADLTRITWVLEEELDGGCSGYLLFCSWIHHYSVRSIVSTRFLVACQRHHDEQCLPLPWIQTPLKTQEPCLFSVHCASPLHWNTNPALHSSSQLTWPVSTCNLFFLLDHLLPFYWKCPPSGFLFTHRAMETSLIFLHCLLVCYSF